MIDAIGLAAIFACTVALAMGWLFASGQTFAKRSVLSAARIVLRLAVVFAVALGVFHNLMGLPLATLFVVSLFVVPWVALVSIEKPPGGGAIEIFVWCILVLPFFITREFVLGFPVRQELFLEPQPDVETPSLDHFHNLNGFVASPLRPTGTIEIDGMLRSARSADGTFIAAGTEVTVCDTLGSSLVVSARTSDSVE